VEEPQETCEQLLEAREEVALGEPDFEHLQALCTTPLILRELPEHHHAEMLFYYSMAAHNLGDPEEAALTAVHAFEMALKHRLYVVIVGARCQQLTSENVRLPGPERTVELSDIRTNMATWIIACKASTDDREAAERYYVAACQQLGRPVEPLPQY
jgi:hypothetical protein